MEIKQDIYRGKQLLLTDAIEHCLSNCGKALDDEHS